MYIALLYVALRKRPRPGLGPLFTTTNNSKTYKRYECRNTICHTRSRLLQIDDCDIHNGYKLLAQYLVISFPDFMFQIPLLALTHIHAVIILLYYSLEHCYRKRKEKLLSLRKVHRLRCVVDSLGNVCMCAVSRQYIDKQLKYHQLIMHSQFLIENFTSIFLIWIARSSSYLSPSRLYILCQYIAHIVWSSAKEKHMY